jgi:CubicO group peptidase (beta-lactamase class C family)
MRAVFTLLLTLILVFPLIACSNQASEDAAYQKIEQEIEELQDKEIVTADKEMVVSETTSELNQFLTEQKFNGVILMSIDGNVLLKKGYGYANFSGRLPNSTETVFRIGSVTKQFTAHAVMLLQQEGLINVDDNVREYIPDFQEGNHITIHQLLSHTSGLPRDLDDFFQGSSLSQEEVITQSKSLELLWKPGSAYSYSNVGYMLLGSIIEQVSGVSYEQYITEHILKPLNMENTGFDEERFLNNPNRAIGYDPNDPLDSDNQFFEAGASTGTTMYSTINDLSKWDEALYSDKLLVSKHRESMFTNYLNEDDAAEELPDGYGYGYGWAIHKKDHNVMLHTGYIAGFSSSIYRDTKLKFLLIHLGNVGLNSGEPVGKATPLIFEIINKSEEQN